MIEREVGFTADEIVMVTDPHGIIFISNNPEWLYQAAWRISQENIGEIAASRQFGNGPWEWIGLRDVEGKYVLDSSGRKYLHHQVEMDRNNFV